ncbi:MAG: hypothetical protein V7L11_23215 [Nostoc sp.]|uniref:hypothetical protein n=1 Tax=Nostoc sp. TaxID=1180 RepID=UPI002FFC1DA7
MGFNYYGIGNRKISPGSWFKAVLLYETLPRSQHCKPVVTLLIIYMVSDRFSLPFN